MLLQALHDNLTTKRIINEEAEFSIQQQRPFAEICTCGNR